MKYLKNKLGSVALLSSLVSILNGCSPPEREKVFHKGAISGIPIEVDYGYYVDRNGLFSPEITDDNFVVSINGKDNQIYLGFAYDCRLSFPFMFFNRSESMKAYGLVKKEINDGDKDEVNLIGYYYDKRRNERELFLTSIEVEGFELKIAKFDPLYVEQ